MGAVDVELAGDGELHLGEAQLTFPREVRIGQQEPALATFDAVASDGPSVAPQAVRIVQPEVGGGPSDRAADRSRGAAPSGRRRPTGSTAGGCADPMKSISRELLASSATDRA